MSEKERDEHLGAVETPPILGENSVDNAADMNAAEMSDAAGAHDSAPEPEPVEVQHAPVEVGLQRSVRVGRLIVVGIVAGVVIGIVLALLFPVQQGADYELGQAVGVAAVFGGAIGLGVGALLALLLGIVARRNRGEAIAVQTDVR